MNKTVDIVYVIPRPEIGGAEKQLLRLIEHLDPTRFRPTLICLDGGGSLLPEFEKVANAIVLNRRGLFDVVTFTRLLTHIRRIRPHTVHATLYIANLFGGWAAKLAGVPNVIVSQRGLGIDPRHSRIKRMVHALFNGFIGIFSDVRLVNSRAIAEKMAQYGWHDCQVIHNGILDRPYPTASSLEALRRELEIPKTAKVLTAVTRLDPKKDLDTMLKAFCEVVANERDVYLLVAGGGFEDYRKHLVETAHKLELIDRVRFLGFRDDVADLIALGDLTVLSSLTEGLPNAILESMLLARPVISTNVGGIPELVDDGIEGYLVDKGDHTGLANRIVELLRNPVRREAMGIFGRSRALSDFSVATTVAKTTATYGAIEELDQDSVPTSPDVLGLSKLKARRWAKSA